MRLTVEVAPSLSDDPGLEWGFMFHDIGNIGIPDRILLKRSSLKAEDWKILQQHTTIGEQLLEHVPLLGGEALRVVRSHHERWDGSGYPDGLAGQEIPLAARIFSVADALDAMTDRRPYRRPLRWEAALARIRKSSGEPVRPGRGRRPRRLRAGSDRDPQPLPRAGAGPQAPGSIPDAADAVALAHPRRAPATGSTPDPKTRPRGPWLGTVPVSPRAAGRGQSPEPWSCRGSAMVREEEWLFEPCRSRTWPFVPTLSGWH